MSSNSRTPAVGRSGGSKTWLANGDQKDGRQMMAVQIGRPEPADHRPMTTSPFIRGGGHLEVPRPGPGPNQHAGHRPAAPAACPHHRPAEDCGHGPRAGLLRFRPRLMTVHPFPPPQIDRSQRLQSTPFLARALPAIFFSS